MNQLVSQFLSGGIMIGFFVIAFFFYRFWKKTRDSLFAVFAAAFSVLAIERILLLVTNGTGYTLDEFRPHVYWVRFLAFMLIIVAFYLKNRQPLSKPTALS